MHLSNQVIRAGTGLTALALLATGAIAAPPGLWSHHRSLTQTDGMAPVMRCADLAGLQIDNTTISSARLVRTASRPSSLYPAAGPEPEHCEVNGEISPRTGVVDPDNGSDQYGVKFQLNLPTGWNGRFFYQGGGGGDGMIMPATGPITSQSSATQTPALWRGYAVVSTNGGHSSIETKAGFGVDPQARVDYGYASIGKTTPVAKAIIAAYYGSAPAHSYFIGCSKGGQEAMQASQKYGDQFDGIVAGDPGYRLPYAAIAESYVTQTLAATAQQMRPHALDRNTGKPLLWAAFSQSDLDLVVHGVLKVCDALDGLSDNMILNPRACAGKFDPATLQCARAKTASCLAPVQVDALKKMFAPLKDSQGKPVYADWPYDSGIASSGFEGGWTNWRLGFHGTRTNLAFNTTLAQSSTSYLFTTPPNPDLSVFDITVDDFLANINATGTDPTTGVDYSRSAVDFMVADSTDLDALKSHGGKLLIYHGQSDPVFSFDDTVAYVDRLTAAYGEQTPDFVRFFPVPGMNHCTGGDYATDSFDTLTAIVDWVEDDVAPDALVATSGHPSSSRLPAGLTRPLCAWPEVAQYDGHGDPDSAASFSCTAP